MLTIHKEQENVIFITLYECTTITDYQYLFTFTNATTKEVKELELEDESEYQYRYNKFVIDEGSTSDLTFDVGEWTYSVSAYNDDESEVVETGIMKVIEAGAANANYETTITNTTYTG